MKRPKVKWRFQKIIAVALGGFILGQTAAGHIPEDFSWGTSNSVIPLGLEASEVAETAVRATAVPATEAEVLEVVLPSSPGTLAQEPPSGDFGLAARALPKAPGSPPALPSIKGTLKDFKLPNEDRFWEVHGLSNNSELKKAVHRLRQHLVGTAREKSEAFRYCDARKRDVARDPRFILTDEGISCLYYRWQVLLRESKEAAQRQQASSPLQKPKKVSSKKKKAGLPTTAVGSLRDFKALASFSYDEVLKRVDFKSESAALKAASYALDNPKDCSLTTARAAVVRDLENHLPSDAVFRMMNQIYNGMAPCLSPEHEAFEVVNLRLALLHLDRKEINRAASLLEVVLQGKKLKDEHSALFWRGYLEHLQTPFAWQAHSAQKRADQTEVKINNTYLVRLVEKYPLTLHALVVDQMHGIDTYERYASRPSPQVSMYQGQEWNLENVSHLLAGIFMVKRSYPELERLARLFDEASTPSASFETAMFQVKFFEAASNQRAVIKTIWSSLKLHGLQHLSEELLECLYPVRFHNEIAQQASYIDPALVFSLIRQESSFNPRATSPVGARGLMQVMPATARKVERKRNIELYDPNTNIRIGSKYLSILRKQHKGDYSRLIASYNAGPNNTKKWDLRYRGEVPLLFADIIPFPETRHYVSGLMRHMYWYRALVSHLKEAPGSAKINWSWSLNDVVPQAELFGLKKGETLQVKLEPLPWMPTGMAQKAAADNK
ncbi:MAG: lytic transglycosylase domain-containing protein [Betaproteobacteria bacterium]|nr:lytic transglycosylase domain-containing protein [Betaproteobacteria bacterium]